MAPGEAYRRPCLVAIRVDNPVSAPGRPAAAGAAVCPVGAAADGGRRQQWHAAAAARRVGGGSGGKRWLVAVAKTAVAARTVAVPCAHGHMLQARKILPCARAMAEHANTHRTAQYLLLTVRCVFQFAKW